MSKQSPKNAAIQRLMQQEREAQMQSAIKRILETEDAPAEESYGPPSPEAPAEVPSPLAPKLEKGPEFLSKKKTPHEHTPMDSADYIQKMLSLSRQNAPTQGEHVQFSYDAPASDEDIKHQFDLAGMLDENGDIKRRDVSSTQDEKLQYLRAMTAKAPTELDLSSVADFANVMSMSGRQVKAPKAVNTSAAQLERYTGLTKAIQEDKDNEMKRQMDQDKLILGGIQGVDGPKGSVGYSKSHPPMSGYKNDHFIQRQSAALNKQMGPRELAEAKVKLQKVFGLIKGFNPEDNTVIPGVGQFGLGKVETLNPWDKDHLSAQQNRAAIMDAIAKARHALTGVAITPKEMEAALEREGLNLWSEPAVLRSYLNSVTQAIKLKVEKDLASAGPEVEEYYYQDPNATRPDEFDTTKWVEVAPKIHAPAPAGKTGAPVGPTAPGPTAPAAEDPLEAELRKRGLKKD